MSAQFAKFTFFLFCCAVALTTQPAVAQFGGGGIFDDGNDVGGIKIDAEGVLTSGKKLIAPEAKRKIEAALQKVDNKLAQAANIRCVSLNGLEAELSKALNTGKQLPREAMYMAGLQRIEYVILSPETNDVIVAGPGEGLKLNADGEVVGEKSGLPPLSTEDFLVAIRSADNARTGRGISVSIDPTDEGTARLQRLYSQWANNRTEFHPELQSVVEDTLGNQTISLTGVPVDSRFAQVLVAADYKMKRLAMGLEASPIEKFPSFMEMALKAKARNVRAAPRFWMECNYDAIARSEDNLVWQIRGQGVKTLTEESHYDKDGKKKIKKKQNKFAVRWAENMTKRFEELAQAEPVFRELRNLMDMSVAAAIISQQRLNEKVSLQTPTILGLTNASLVPSRAVAKVIPSECSFVKIANSWLVSASGGVQLDPWGVAAKTETVAAVGKVGDLAASNPSDNWWWNASN